VSLYMAMFNSMGYLDEYSAAFDNNPEILGSAVWKFQDQALWNKRDPNILYWLTAVALVSTQTIITLFIKAL
jgi:hypothetical protein